MRTIDDEQSPRIERVKTPRLAGTFLVSGFVMAALGSSRLLIPLIALSLGASSFLIGVAAALFTAVPMLLSVPFGRWMDRTGTLPAVMLSAMMIVLAALLYGAMPSQYSLLAVAGLIGTAGVFTHMAATRAVGLGVEVAERAKSLGYLVLSYSLFNFFGPVITTHAFEHYGATLAIAVLGLFAVFSIAGIRSLPHFYTHERQGAANASGSRKTYDLLGISDLRLWIVISSVFTANQTLFPFILSLHTAQIGLPASQAGWVLGAFAFGTFTSRFFTPLLVKHVSANAILILALIVAAGVYAVIPLAHGTLSLITLSGALGLPLGVGAPVSLALIYEVAPSGRVNEALGISMSANNLLQTVFPMVIGVAANGLVAFMVWGWALIIMASAAWIMSRRKQLKQEAA
ncbi:MFS transporter [Pseudomonas sp. TWI929]|uniref:MFS transporter n=1 Tax=Pseudomonas sp. TWI929 TaxID=3136795 RepID=UPI003209B7DD